MNETISILRNGQGNYEICLSRDGEDFYSVLAEVKESNFAPEHGLDAEKVARYMAGAYAHMMEFKLG